jgi:hypothetical protein
MSGSTFQWQHAGSNRRSKKGTTIDGSLQECKAHGYQPLRDILNDPPTFSTLATRMRTQFSQSPKALIAPSTSNPAPAVHSWFVAFFARSKMWVQTATMRGTRSSFLSLSWTSLSKTCSCVSSSRLSSLILYQPSLFDHAQPWRDRFGEGADRTTLLATVATSEGVAKGLC